MLLVYDSNNYKVNESHFIDKEVEYTIFNTDTQETSIVKGASLLLRIKKELKSDKFTINNLSYRNKPPVYMDVPIIPQKQIRFDIFNGTYFSSFSAPFSVKVFALRKNKGYIAINDRCLYFEKRRPNLGVDNGRHEAYNLVFGCEYIVININSSCILKSVIFDNIEISNNCMKFKLIFNIFNEEQNNYDYSVSIPIIIDFDKNLIISDKFTSDLMSLTNYTAKILVNSNSTTMPEFKFAPVSSLSNYYICPVQFDGRLYDSSEAAYQSMKTTEKTMRDMFIGLTPNQAKFLGRKIQLRPDWDELKEQVMYDIVKSKFMQNPDCLNDLRKTKGYALVEDTTGWCDRVWGKCYCPKCKGTGENMLGIILTKLRRELCGVE